MPYKKIEGESLKVLLASYKTFNEDLKKLGADKAKKEAHKKMQAEMKVKSKTIGTLMSKMAAEAKALYNQHNLIVENLLSDSTIKVKELKEGLATLKKTKKLTTFPTLAKYPEALKANADQGKQESGELADAWMAVRSGGYSDKGLEPNDYKDFHTIRNDIINGLKPTGAKLNKLYELASAGKVLVNDMRIEVAKGDGKPDEEPLKQAVAKLIDSHDEQLKEVKQTLTSTTQTHERITNMLKDKTISKDQVNVAQSAATDFLKQVKAIQGYAKTMTQKTDQMDTIGKGHYTEIDKSLKQARDRVKTMEQNFKAGMALYKAMVANSEKLLNRNKAGK